MLLLESFLIERLLCEVIISTQKEFYIMVISVICFYFKKPTKSTVVAEVLWSFNWFIL